MPTEQIADNEERPDKKKPIFSFIINASQSESLLEGVELFRREHGPQFDIRLFHVHDIVEEAVSPVQVRAALRESAIVFLDIRGGGKAAGIAASTLSETSQPVLVLVGGSPELMQIVRLGSFSFASIAKRSERKGGKAPSFNIRRFQKILNLVEKIGGVVPIGNLKHARNWVKATRYWRQGGAENIKNMLAFTGRHYAHLRVPKPAPPMKYPPFGIYDFFANKYYNELENYLTASGYDRSRPAVGLLFYGGMHFAQSIVPAKRAAESLRHRHKMNILPVFADAGHNLEAIKKFFCTNGKSAVDAIIYFQWFQLTTFAEDEAEQSRNLLKSLNVPIFDGAPMYGREVEKWLESEEGLSPVESLTTVILPELDGMIEPLPTAGLDEVKSGDGETVLKKVIPIDDRIERLCERVAKMARLRHMQNSEKRVAFIIYDNPPGEDNLGNAAYLDVFESIRYLMQEMKERDYRVEGIPEKGSFHELFLSNGLVNKARWGGQEKAVKVGKSADAVQYVEWLKATPSPGEVIEAWGEPPGEVMIHDDRFIIPALEFGNVLVGVQPARGYHTEPDKITHDKTLPPNHQYVAFYRWLEQEWKPDVMVHVGTHGTLEFLKGKEIGMSKYCWPEILTGATPHLYIYHVVNASEATIAKRRSLATLINYNSPSFTSSDLYDEYSSLDELIAEYVEAKFLEPNRAERLSNSILEKAGELNLECESVEEIQEEIALMKRSIIPKGLHRFGADISEEDRIDFATFLLRYDRGEVASLHRLLAEAKGFDYRELLKNPIRPTGEGARDVLGEIELEARSIVSEALRGGKFIEDKRMRLSVQFATAVADKLGGKYEIENFLAGMEGRYVEPGLGGDPIRNPETLPTGRNSYQFDPRLVPSEEAIKRGSEIAENTLKCYFEKHGEYPKSTAVILWGFETTKTRGETVGQVLAYLGVKIAEGSNPWHKKLESIPLNELGRPRIDCHVQICGFFRDMYPNVLSMLNRAFDLVSSLDENDDQNYVRFHTLQLEEKLRGQVEDGRLAKIARGRIFGPRPGEYGTRTTHLIETSAWESEEEIANLFASSMSHLYAENIHGERISGAFNERVKKIDLVSQVRDSHEYEIADLDHYYEFFGGLSRTVESIRGKPPEMLISDTTKEFIRTENVADSLNRGIRTRLLNPKWIDELLKHDYHGAQKICDRVEYLIGFAATTHAVKNWVWSGVTKRYVEDDDMFRRMAQNNRFAMEEILRRLMEAHQRKYWDATEEELDLIEQRFQELEAIIEDMMK